MAFNAYVQLTGCTNLKRPCTLSDDTPIVHLLSYSTESESGNDLLYSVICDVVCMVPTMPKYVAMTCSCICFVFVFLDQVFEPLCSCTLRKLKQLSYP